MVGGFGEERVPLLRCVCVGIGFPHATNPLIRSRGLRKDLQAGHCLALGKNVSHIARLGNIRGRPLNSDKPARHEHVPNLLANSSSQYPASE